MLFGTMQKLEHCSDYKVQLHGKEIERVSTFCYLRLTLEGGLLSRIRPFPTLKVAKCMYNCLVQPVFDCTDTVWGGLSIGCGNNLQRLQNRAAHITQRRATTEKAFKMLGKKSPNAS